MTTACAGYNGPVPFPLDPLPQPVAQPKLSAVRADRDAAVRPVPGRAAQARANGAAHAPGAAAEGARRSGNLRFAGALPPARIPPESLAPVRRISAIGVAIVVSVALHAVAMAIHFTFGSGRVTDNSPRLQIALVNAKSASKPAQADLLAQANLDGGGNTEKDRRAKTPLPVLQNEPPRQDVAVASTRAVVQDNVTREMLTQLRSGVVVPMPEPKPVDESEQTDSPTANEMMQRTLEAMRLEAQIARDMDAYQKIPRRKFIGAQAKEYRFARYVEDWRMKVERIGNTNYPEAARQNRLYGSLILSVSIRADGSIENVEVKKKSGHRLLDAAAVKIVEMAGPYSPFPEDIRRDTDILNITRTWTFAKGDELHSE
jgi:protein TonB